MDQFLNDDSTSNHSDSSSSSTNLMSRQQQVLHGNTCVVTRSVDVQPVQYESLVLRDEQAPTIKNSANTTKRALITKNVGTSGKRKRNVSASVVTTIKREPQSELNDEVGFIFLLRKNLYLNIC